MAKKKGKSPQKRKTTQSRRSTPAAKKVVKTAPVADTPEVKESVRKPQPEKAPAAELPFGRMNYILLIACVGLIVLGFFLMSLEGFIDAKQFSIALYIAPPIVITGFIGIIYAIMYRPKEKSAGAS